MVHLLPLERRPAMSVPTPDLVQFRRDLHRHPELGLDLPRTQAAVLDALSGLDLEVTTGGDLTSVTAVLRGEAPTSADHERPTVLLRGDMDALPLQEEVDVAYRSSIDGRMHACGHDLHTTMLVGAAHRLHAQRGQLAGDVVFMFQPGEEGDDGAGHMIAEGVLDAAGRRPDAAWALHVMAGRLPRGVVATRGGPLLASSNELHVTVRGRGGHGSAPDRAQDPVPVAAAMVTGLQVLLSRIVSPFDPTVMTVGEFHAGTKPNIIPDTARFGATLRCFDDAVLDRLEHETVRYCHGIAAAHGLDADVQFARLYPVTVNDADAVAQARQVVSQVLGTTPGTSDDPADDRWVDLPTPFAGSEDFSRILQAVPGAMLFLGACPPGIDPVTGPDNHSPVAAFDDDVIDDGVAVLAALASDTLTTAAAGSSG